MLVSSRVSYDIWWSLIPTSDGDSSLRNLLISVTSWYTEQFLSSATSLWFAEAWLHILYAVPSPQWEPAWNWTQSAPRAPACRELWPAATGSRTRTFASRPVRLSLQTDVSLSGQPLPQYLLLPELKMIFKVMLFGYFWELLSFVGISHVHRRYILLNICLFFSC